MSHRRPAAPADRRALTDTGTVVLAVCTAAGAWCSAAVPLWAGLVVAGVGLARRRPWWLVVGATVLASALGARAHAGLVPPPASAFSGQVTLVGDPVEAFGGVRVDARAGSRRVELHARGAPAAALADRLAGERVAVEGALRPPSGAVRARLARRHVSAQLTVREVTGWSPAAPVPRVANSLRRTLTAGAAPLGPLRPLFTGMVIGDDRDQPAVVADDFRAAGLTHLLAVSGQNVAFVLVLAGPVLARLGLRSTWVATVAVIAFFALLTRFEPSVLRASAMAAIACTARGLGRPASGVRILALAVSALLLADPLLVRSVGFLLSVGASAGILVLARPVARRLPGPRWLAELVGVTLAAQVGVAPVLLPVFGGIPVASLPANVLAVPAAAPLMMWGLTGGLLAGVLGPPFDGWLHVPSGWLVGWVAAVARWAAALPLGSLGPGHVGALSAVALLAWWGRTRASRATAVIAVAGALAVVVAPALAPARDVAVRAAGMSLWRADGAVVVVVDDPFVPTVLARLRAAGVDRVDVLVTRRGGRLAAGTVLELRSRVDVRLVLAPVGHRVRDATVAPLGRVGVGGLVVDVTRNQPTLEVAVSRARSAPP